MEFQEVQIGTLQYLKTPLLAVPHGFSTRLGGVSEGAYASLNLRFNCDDARENVFANYARFASAVGFDPQKLVCACQVHGDTVRTVTQDDAGKGIFRHTDYEADSLICQVPGMTLMIYSADCGMILLEDSRTGAVGACHAGWRGTAQDIAGKTVRAMEKRFGTRTEDLRAAIGPCIGMCCFETDRDVPDAMEQVLGPDAWNAMERTGEKYHVDLKLLNEMLLRRAGVRRIAVCDDCTACDSSRFWSHRVCGENRGSLAAVIRVGGNP